MDIDFVKDLGAAIKGETAPGIKMKVINKDDFKDNLTILIERMKAFAENLGSFVGNDQKNLATAIHKAAASRENIACNAYVAIAKAVGKKDTTIAFDSASFVINNYVSILESLNRNTATAFKDKAITVYNTKLSHVAIFGLLDEAERFLNFTTYLFDNVTYEICQHNGVRELPQPKKYRLAMIQKNMDFYIGVMKNRLQNTAAVVITEIDKIRQQQDVSLVGDDNEANIGFIQPSRLTPMAKNLLAFGARKFFIFRWLGEQWNLIKHARYLKAKKEKEWMEAHVAILKLELQGVDPNSDEYRKQVKIIEAYNEMIAEQDQKIDAYLND